MKHIRCDFCHQDDLAKFGRVVFHPPVPDMRVVETAIDYTYGYDACPDCFAKLQKLLEQEWRRAVKK